ncbi:hypothetical protein [Streptomyces sparsogenes]|uniref:hypothetical protein n=1 Tax=Streptomyces sparsogenes TaxID=67365 RepID=UPI0033EC9475
MNLVLGGKIGSRRELVAGVPFADSDAAFEVGGDAPVERNLCHLDPLILWG